MYNPKHPSDARGMRTDMIEGLRSAVCLPSVCPEAALFPAGTGRTPSAPIAQRKTNLDLAWHQYVPNEVGHDEYLQWAEKVGAEAMYTINLGTGTINDARDIVEYTNFERAPTGPTCGKPMVMPLPMGLKPGTWAMRWTALLASWEKNPTGCGILAHMRQPR